MRQSWWKASSELRALSRSLRFIIEHPMNRGRRGAALVRFAHWQIRSRIQAEVIVNWIGSAKLAVRRGMTGPTGNIYCGLHEYVDMRFVLDTLKPGDLFVDIGANVGSYTVLASKVCGARTIAVEPDPDSARALRRNIQVNAIGDMVRVVESALGATEGKVCFTVGLDTVNRVARPSDTETRQVDLRTLDAILDGKVPKILKIDVEGFEAEVFKGAERTLSHPDLKAIITEAQDETVLNMLSQVGFSRAHYDPEHAELRSSPRYSSHNALMVRINR